MYCHFLCLDEVHGDSCGCPGDSASCQRHCVQRYPDASNVKGECKGMMSRTCKCSVDDKPWYSIGGMC